MSNFNGLCALCDRSLAVSTDYLYRGSCGHHLCAMCAFPLLRCGKALCTLCPAAVQPSGVHSELGSIVIGSDSEQIEYIANQLRMERAKEVSQYASAARE